MIAEIDDFYKLLGGFLLAGASALITSLFFLRRTKSETDKNNAETVSLISEAAATTLKDLMIARNELKVALEQAREEATRTVNGLRDEIHDLRNEVEELRKLVVTLGGDPAAVEKIADRYQRHHREFSWPSSSSQGSHLGSHLE